LGPPRLIGGVILEKKRNITRSKEINLDRNIPYRLQKRNHVIVDEGGRVAYSEHCREKLSQFKIARHSKPFIDKDLQLQIPGCDLNLQQNHPTPSPIYSHYVGNNTSSYFSPYNETDLLQAIKQAEGSYHAWKLLQQQIKSKIS
jgi:hypothetical protein